MAEAEAKIKRDRFGDPTKPKVKPKLKLKPSLYNRGKKWMKNFLTSSANTSKNFLKEFYVGSGGYKQNIRKRTHALNDAGGGVNLKDDDK